MYFVLQLIDAFGHKSNISLVFDFMETDLEVRLLKTFYFSILRWFMKVLLYQTYICPYSKGDFYYVSW